MKYIFNLILIIYILSSCTNGIKLLEKNKRDFALLMEGKDYQTSLKRFVDYFINHNTKHGDTIIFNDLKIINELGNYRNTNVYFKNYINNNYTFEDIQIYKYGDDKKNLGYGISLIYIESFSIYRIFKYPSPRIRYSFIKYYDKEEFLFTDFRSSLSRDYD